ncbi:D-amino-acid oxidase [Allocatelliglobosispora scoriae]|uniref:D-amino-acid oxidase n=1 Tax=Allocatelliglobosispora scoriae TaxID=643052 RepID=A0A841BRN8_9ACTN|nr:D-amino-acid oxidase [Allocatelliglobosispora scoriae]
MIGWGERTREVLQALAADADHGVSMVLGIDAVRQEEDPPDWVLRLPRYRLCEPHEVPTGFRSGWWYEIPLIDMPVYLGYLERRLRRAGGTIEKSHRVEALGDVSGSGRVTVNCTGIGARTLVPDDSLRAVQGLLVVVDQPEPRIEHFFQDDADEGDLLYILPHRDVVVLGGCALPGDVEIGDDAAAAIMARCFEVEPRLRGQRVVAIRHGVRPKRKTARVERDEVDGHPLVHNYGHGGSGVTVSWGCAEEALGLVRAALAEVDALI